MALDAVGLQQPLRYTVDLKEGLVQQPMSSQLMKGDKKANRVIVRITNGSETVDLSGVGVSGSFIRPPDEAELTLPGSVNGNEAVIVLDDLCYAEEGYCEIDVRLTVNGVSRTVLALTGYVLAKGNGAYIDVGNVIPSIDDIIAQYAEMKAVTERTLAAAQRAEALSINASGYAGDSNKLGGQPPSYYARQETVNQLSQEIATSTAFTLTASNGFTLDSRMYVRRYGCVLVCSLYATTPSVSNDGWYEVATFPPITGNAFSNVTTRASVSNTAMRNLQFMPAAGKINVYLTKADAGLTLLGQAISMC